MIFRVELKGIEEARALFDEKRIQRAVVSALNKTAAKAKTAAMSAITDKYNIKKTHLGTTATGNSRIELKMASIGNQQAIISISGRPISLAYFGARQVVVSSKGQVRLTTRDKSRILKRRPGSLGVSVEIIKGKRTPLSGAFLAAVKAGDSGFHIGVFQRHGRKRLPIFEKRMITVASMFGSAAVEEVIRKSVKENFERIFLHELDYYTGRTGI